MKFKHSLGLDIDHYSMRGVAMTHKNSGQNLVVVEKAAEIHGTFIKDSEIVAGLKELRHQLGVHGHGARIASTIGGKQVFTSKVPFQKMPEGALKKALKLDIRKELPFEASSATLEFQKLNNGETRHDDKVDLMVAATTNTLLNRHVRLLTDGGLKPAVVEALPIVIANTFWEGVKEESMDAANIILHIGPDTTTLVIDGERLPYYTRQIYFSAGEMFSPAEDESSILGNERANRFSALAEEIIRSLSYYEDTFENVSFSTINIIGSYTDSELVDSLRSLTKLVINVSDLSTNVASTEKMSPGQYDLALALALQALE